MLDGSFTVNAKWLGALVHGSAGWSMLDSPSLVQQQKLFHGNGWEWFIVFPFDFLSGGGSQQS